MHRASVFVLMSIVLAVGLVAGCASQSDCDRSQVENAELKVGDAAPDFHLPDHRGGFVKLSDHEGKSNVVIAFFPAAFTPV